MKRPPTENLDFGVNYPEKGACFDLAAQKYYHPPFMSQQLEINGFAFAREAAVLEGCLKVADLFRLHDLLTTVSGEVQFAVSGCLGGRDQPLLRVEARGILSLACQRCLQTVAYDLEVDNLLELVPEGVELTQNELEDDSRDFLPVAGVLDVVALIEDEILLALPAVPRHENCGLPGVAEAGGRITPFTALSGLKGKLN